MLFVASRQQSFTSIYVMILLYCLCFMPTLALTPTHCLSTDARSQAGFWCDSGTGCPRADEVRF
jgi:hypothetical protein